ncbi:MAG TPA: DUF819 family protein [Spirochaetales bacterium]|nr:DUF819 family protein [Spirochaetales bacterium]HRY53975.1 DUF819 family protein [Spirochaetia bacterium]
MAELAVAAFCFSFPAIALLLKEKVSYFSKWSPLIACYTVGLVLGNLGILPKNAPILLDGISTGAVALSIPLLLFSVDIRRWRELAGTTLRAFGLAVIAVMTVSAAAHLLFKSSVPDSWSVAGILVGVYTGGTPNMAAIKTALGADMNSYLAVHTSDMILSAVYFLFVLTAAKRFFSLFMPAYNARRHEGGEVVGSSQDSSDEEPSAPPFTALFAKGIRAPLAAALGLDLAVVAVGLGASLLVPAEWQTMTAILGITTFALAASLSPRLRTAKGTFQAGEYILYVFCLAVGAMGDISKLIGAAPHYFAYVAVVLFGSFTLHAALCAICKVDVDTFLVVSTATINSPPFVGLTCVAIGNRRLLVPGITAGIMGYALGNYLGIGLAQLLRSLG